MNELTTRLLSPQPMSVHSERSESITSALLVSEANPDIKEALVERNRIGVETYHVELETFNGRDFPADLFQELIDAMKYAKGAQMENHAKWSFRKEEMYSLALMHIRAATTLVLAAEGIE